MRPPSAWLRAFGSGWGGAGCAEGLGGMGRLLAASVGCRGRGCLTVIAIVMESCVVGGGRDGRGGSLLPPRLPWIDPRGGVAVGCDAHGATSRRRGGAAGTLQAIHRGDGRCCRVVNRVVLGTRG